MGLRDQIVQELKRRYGAAFSFKAGTNHTVVIVDIMAFIKHLPENCITTDDAVIHFVERVKEFLYDGPPCVHTLIVLADRDPPAVKRMVEYAIRYKHKDTLDPKNGPYLSAKGTSMLPDWPGFSAERKNLQRELFPRLLNAFMGGKLIVPRPGQKIVLSGFPGYIEYVQMHKQQSYALHTNEKNEIAQIHYWNVETDLPITEEMEKADTALYNRVFMFENIPPCDQWPQGYHMRREWELASNSISESDAAMYFFDHFFQRDNIMFVCNDRDVIPYGMLYGLERVTANNCFRNIHYACLPYKKKKNQEFFGKNIPRYEMIDLNMLNILIGEDKVLQLGGVQNPVASIAFVILATSCDFFKGGFFKIGIPIIWNTFFECVDVLSHMVQLSRGVTPSTRTPREFIIDEDAFRLYVYYIYLNKYGSPMLKKNKKMKYITFNDLKKRCSVDGKGKPQQDVRLHLPSRNLIRCWSRQIEWCITYFKNGPLGAEFVPDPFEKFNDIPYYPYVLDEVTGKPSKIDFVCARQKPIDEVFAQHLFRNKKRTKDRNQISESKKQKIIEEFDSSNDDDEEDN